MSRPNSVRLSVLDPILFFLGTHELAAMPTRPTRTPGRVRVLLGLAATIRQSLLTPPSSDWQESPVIQTGHLIEGPGIPSATAGSVSRSGGLA